MVGTASAYSQIQALHGMDEFKQLANRLCAVAESKRTLCPRRFVLPGFLFAAAPGCGVTTHLRLFAQLLYELNLQRFEGERRVFEHILPYSASKEKMELTGLLQRMNQAAGFRSEFRGVIGLDIDAWVNHANDLSLEPLLAFAADYAESITLVYEVEMRPDHDLEPIIARLANETPLEIVHFPTPTAQQLTAYLEAFLNQRGCTCDEPAKERLFELIAEMRETKLFDGLQTLDNLADELVYRFMAAGMLRGNQIGIDLLGFVTEEGGFMDRLRFGKNKSARRSIGFL